MNARRKAQVSQVELRARTREARRDHATFDREYLPDVTVGRGVFGTDIALVLWARDAQSGKDVEIEEGDFIGIVA
jgi:hypothetical protein